LSIYRRSDFGSLVDLSNRTWFYYLCLALLLGTIFLVRRIVNSRFGMVIQGSRLNDRRMQAIGFPTYRYRLTCFVIAGALCGLAGALLANHTEFVSPAMMHWTRSGDLIVMVVLGGMASTFGPLFGAVALLVLEETLPLLIRGVTYVLMAVLWPFLHEATLLTLGKTLSHAPEYWQILLGPLLLLVVLFARGGINGMLKGARRG
jgi:branched-chain amino acid transport system permease protein